jgi:FAD/FMN-containing dehydrogenase
VSITEFSVADRLRQRVRGAVVARDDADWDAARLAYNVVLDQQPAAVVRPVDEDDVIEVVRFAREHGLQVAPQRTGHNAASLGSLEDAILLRTDAMIGVEIDVEARRARVQAGAKWEHVVPRASELGLAALHGSTPDVSVVGYSLGGGLGWYARKLGLAANSVTAIELVTPDGRLLRTDAEHEPELFWALRGGGGNFGVVTAMEFMLFPLSEVYAGVLFFPWERSAEVLHAWHAWTASVPDEMTSVGRILQFPPLPEVPEPLRGNAFVLVEGIYLGPEEDGAALMEPLRALGPVMDTFAMVPPVGIAELHMDPPDPLPYVGGHQLLGALPEQAIDDLVAVAGPGSGSIIASVELRHIGGELARDRPHHGALSTLSGAFAMYAVGMAMDAGMAAAVEGQIDRVKEALAPYDVGRYTNFTEVRTSPRDFFPARTVERLRAVKAAFDPDGVIRANHPVGV